MDAIFSTLGTAFGTWATEKTADKILENAKNKLILSQLAKAINTATHAATEAYPLLFGSCEPRYLPKFLEHWLSELSVDQLRLPLDNNGTPSQLFLEEAFTTALESHKDVKANINLLPDWLRVFIHAYVEKTAFYIELQVFKAQYLVQLKMRLEQLVLQGISTPRREEENICGLLDIFVIPTLEEDISSREDYTRSLEAILLNKLDRQSELIEEQRLRAQLKKGNESRTVSLQQILLQDAFKKVVILGDPGSGKTTLLNYLALISSKEESFQFALPKSKERLPIFIRIRDYEKHENNILEYLYSEFRDNFQITNIPHGALEYWLSNGDVLLLIDGLDEVASDNKRNRVVEKIHSFLEQFPSNTVCISSRPAGYRRNYFRVEKFPHLILQPFNQNQIDEYVDKWYETREPDFRRRKDFQNSLKKIIREGSRIRQLASNPLLLTIIALVYRHQAHLPQKRYKLYEEAIKTLLTSWDMNKELEQYKSLKYIENDDMPRLMQKLAYWIHTQGGAGEEGGTLVDKDELIVALGNFIKEMKRIELYQAKEEAVRFLDYVRIRSGLMNEQGNNCYAFVHKTFQEYLTAQEILYRQEDEDFTIVLEHISSHLHDPHWKEVLLLLVAQLKPKKVRQALDKILSCEAPCEKWLYQNIFFLGECLAENVPLEASSDEFIESLLKRFVHFEAEYKSILQDRAFQALSNLVDTDYQKKGWQFIEPMTRQIDLIRLERYRYNLSDKNLAIENIQKILIDQDRNKLVRINAAMVLGQIGQTSPEIVLPVLLDALKDQSEVRVYAAMVLGQIGQTSPETVIPALLDALKDQSDSIRIRVAMTLGQIGQTSPEIVLPALLDALKDQNDSVRAHAAEALGQIGQTSPETVIPVLLDALKDQSDSVRIRVAMTLGQIGQTSPETVIPALLDALKDQSGSVRVCAVIALGQIGQTSPETVIPALLDALKEQSDSVRAHAAEALGQIGQTSPETVIPVLLDALKDQSDSVRIYAAMALGQIRQTSPETVIPVLLDALKDQSDSIRIRVAMTLGQIGQTSPEIVLPALLDALKDQSDLVRAHAAEALGQIGQTSPETVIPALLDALKDQNDSVRAHAAEALGQIGQTSPEIVAALLEGLNDQGEEARFDAAIALGQLGQISPETVIPALLNTLKDGNGAALYSATESIKRLAKKVDVQHQIIIWLEQQESKELIERGTDLLWFALFD
jgi:HEAT repeat protein/energy-coupling factor transporter ATP-binding protein EcfA2